MSELITALEFESSKDKNLYSAIFGGTFDPIHEGHVKDIKFLAQNCEYVFIAPTTQNPWKDKSPVSFEIRIEMVKLVLDYEKIAFNQPGVIGKGVNIINSPYTFSVDLVSQLQYKHKKKLLWAIGEDLIESSKGWKDWKNKGVPLLVLPLLNGFSGTSIRGGEIPPHPALDNFIKLNALY